jgi:hypothetical protein
MLAVPFPISFVGEIIGDPRKSINRVKVLPQPARDEKRSNWKVFIVGRSQAFAIAIRLVDGPRARVDGVSVNGLG